MAVVVDGISDFLGLSDSWVCFDPSLLYGSILFLTCAMVYDIYSIYFRLHRLMWEHSLVGLVVSLDLVIIS